jgi:polysaccharide biosynthesis PFTS motif protein
MYSLITKSHLVIVYPFSSPAYVADSVGVPTIYYDPTGSIVRCDFSDPPSLIQFANTRKKLHELSLKVLGLGFQ